MVDTKGDVPVILKKVTQAKIRLWDSHASRVEIRIQGDIGLPVPGFDIIEGKVIILTCEMDIGITVPSAVPSPVEIKLIFIRFTGFG
jgi:hypothetical protein